jgi:hypothetical protein
MDYLLEPTATTQSAAAHHGVDVGHLEMLIRKSESQVPPIHKNIPEEQISAAINSDHDYAATAPQQKDKPSSTNAEPL